MMTDGKLKEVPRCVREISNLTVILISITLYVNLPHATHKTVVAIDAYICTKLVESLACVLARSHTLSTSDLIDSIVSALVSDWNLWQRRDGKLRTLLPRSFSFTSLTSIWRHEA